MQVTVEIINVYKVTGKNGKSKEFKKAGASWNDFIELLSADSEKLILSCDNNAEIDPFFNLFCNEKEFNVIKASPQLIVDLDLIELKE